MVAIRDYVMPESCFDCLFVDSLLSPDERDDRSYFASRTSKTSTRLRRFARSWSAEDTPERPRSEEIALLKQGVRELARIREQLAWIKKEIGK